MAQREAVDTSLAYVDSADRYAPEQYPTGYYAMRSAIIEAAQASGELQPLTEAEMERRAQQEARIEHLFREARQAEIYAQNLSVEETCAALQELEERTVPTFGFLHNPQGVGLHLNTVYLARWIWPIGEWSAVMWVVSRMRCE